MGGNEVQRLGTSLGGGADDPCLRESTVWISVGSFKCQRLNPLALVGTMGGLMIKERGGRKQQEKVRGGVKAIKGENTE